MNDIEKRLRKEKGRIDTLTAPQQLEDRLRSALNQTERKRKTFTGWKLKLAVVVLVLLTVGTYHYNALAYYGKQLFGFDELLSDTIKNLHEQGMGQIIEETTTLFDGTELIINGMMSDANQMIIYYTLVNPTGIEDPYHYSFQLEKVTGFLTNSMVNSQVSMVNDTNTEIKAEMILDAVSPFSRTLTLHYREAIDGNQRVEGTISFPYNPNQAMKTQLKKSIRKTIEVDKGTITFQSITASPTSTVIEGRMNVENYDRISLGLYGIHLVANEERMSLLGSARSTSFKGHQFHIRYDALPTELDSLTLEFDQFVGYKQVNAKLPVSSNKNSSFDLDGTELLIKDIVTTSQQTEITFATEQDVLLDQVSIKTGNEQIPLSTTTNHTEVTLEDGQTLWQRTMVFPTTNSLDYLLIEGLHYKKEYSQRIEIPVN